MVQYFPIVTGSLTVTGSVNVSGSITTNSTITATTLVVQTITSSISAITGSTQFGSLLTNTHVFSGSVTMNPGGLFVSGSGLIGIGTTSPTDTIGYGKALDIQSSTGAAVYLRDSDAPTTQYGFIAYDGNDNGLKINNENSSGFIRFNTSGSERIRVTSAGLVGIGNATPLSLLSVNGTISSTIRSNTISPDNNTTNNFQGYGGYWALRTDTSNNFNLDVYNTGTPKAALTILQSGNVGIGTSSPNEKMTIANGAGAGAALTFQSNGVSSSSELYIGQGGSNEAYVFNRANQYLVLGTNNTERMRITSAGVVGIGNTTYNPTIQLKTGGGTSYRGMITLDNSNDEISLIAGTDQGYAYGPFIHLVGKDRYGTNTAGWIDIISGNASGNTSYGFITFQTANTLRMQISWNGAIGTTAGGTNIYNPSDIRLKKNIISSPYGLNEILLLKPSKFNWRDGFSESEQDKDMLGFIAQDVQEVIPEAVESFGSDVIVKTEEYDFSVENPLRVNEKFIIPVLVKAIQELTARVQELENK